LQRAATPAHRSVWWNEYLALFLTIWMVGTVVWAMGRAGWDPILHRLLVVAVPAVLVGYGFARLWRVPIPALHGLGLLAGSITCLTVTLTAPGAGSGSPRHRLVLLWDRAVDWARAAWQGQALHDPVLFLLVMSALVFGLVYWVIWWTFRIPSSLLAIGVPGATLVITVGLATLPGRWYLGAYLLAAIPLAARFAGFRQEWQWQKSWIAYPLSLRTRYLRVGSALAIVLVLMTLFLPLSLRIDAISEAWKRAQEPVQRAITQAQDRFAQTVEGGNQPTVIPGFASFGPRFQLAGSLNLSDAPAVSLTAQEPHYLSANAYDFYTGLGWEDHSTSTFNAQGPNGALYSPQVSVGAKQLVPRPPTGMEATATVSCDAQFLRPRGTLLYGCGQTETTSVDTRVSLSWQRIGQTGVTLPAPATANAPPALTTLLRLVTNVEGLNLAGDVPAVGPNDEATFVRPDGTLVITTGAARLRTWNPGPSDLAGYVTRAAASQPAGAKPITRVLLTTPGSAASGTESADPRFDAIEAEQDRLRKQLIDTQLVIKDGRVTMLLYRGQTPNFADVTALDAASPLAAGDRIATTARVSVATVEQLRAATTQYPAWVDRYRTLPDGSAPGTIATPQRVRDLATRLARGQTNTYDIAATIEKYLRSTYGYQTTITSPPANRDVVDYFLFDAKQGYCEYFATAMTVLLRADGIPARIVTGYLPGSRQPDGTFLSRESQAHAWVEVWFPQYGWIMFDPTPRPDVPPLQRGSLSQPPPATPTPAPAPTAATAPQPPAPNGAAPTPQPTASAASLPEKGGRHLSPLLFLIPLTLALLWGLAAWYWFLPLRGLAPAAQWYARLQRSARILGVPNARAATPYETAEAIGERLPEGRAAAYAIAHSYAEEQYAGRPPHPDFAASLRDAWNDLRSQTLRARLGRRRDR
jgi:transglutaminase-like putative cysteine protease